MSRKKEQDTKTSANSNALVFLNTPIYDKSEDILGIQAHVDSLQAAIDSGAQMIAVTSPFGAGKSSVTELLHSQNANQEVINVSMWSHLCQSETPSSTHSTTELHRSFLYQIVSQLNAKAGAYISRRLSKNYGLLKLHTESVGYYVVAFISLVFFILGYVLPYVFHIGIPTIWGEPEVWNGLMLLVSVVCLVYVIARAEIVFSSNKSEGSRALNAIKYRYADEVIFSLLPANIVTQEQLPMLQGYFNRAFQQNTRAHNILLYISKMQPAIAKRYFIN